ncbi:MAG: GNAT family N-acetyltransferase [Alphaproteobacteria bacterium]|nr:GNAT family N-acetyltransferase [Alphaproteobacteria bacterium]
MVLRHDIVVRRARPEDTERWLSMRLSLWPETDEHQHREEIDMMLSNSSRYCTFVCETIEHELFGFAEVSLREWAEGCVSSPVGYLEGWFVEENMRRRGAGANLLNAAEDWARSHGCVEMASDTNLGNKASEAAHRTLGFKIAARVVAFRKDLGPR